MAPVTDRGRYLKKLLSDGRVESVRGLARLIAKRRKGSGDVTLDELEKVRRTLNRYFSPTTTQPRDVSDPMVEEISAVLGIDPSSWPPKRPSPWVRLKAEVEELRGDRPQSAEEADGLRKAVDPGQAERDRAGRQLQHPAPRSPRKKAG